MAIPLSTYGNTLSELQAGTNAAQALDYQRANAQDAISQQRLEAFLRLRGQELQAKAQQNKDAADRAQRMAELLQQNSQFGTTEANRMKLGELEARTRENVAKTAADVRGMDPRALDTILNYNLQGQEKVAAARAMSAQRKALLAEIKAANSYHYFKANGPAYKVWKDTFGREPDAKSAATRLGTLETQAAQSGLEADDDIGSPTFGGFKIPSFTPISPGGLRGASPIPTPPPPQPGQPDVPAMFRGAGGGASWAEPVQIGPPPASPSTNVLRWNPSMNDFTF